MIPLLLHLNSHVRDLRSIWGFKNWRDMRIGIIMIVVASATTWAEPFGVVTWGCCYMQSVHMPVTDTKWSALAGVNQLAPTSPYVQPMFTVKRKKNDWPSKLTPGEHFRAIHEIPERDFLDGSMGGAGSLKCDLSKKADTQTVALLSRQLNQKGPNLHITWSTELTVGTTWGHEDNSNCPLVD